MSAQAAQAPKHPCSPRPRHHRYAAGEQNGEKGYEVRRDGGLRGGRGVRPVDGQEKQKHRYPAR